MAANKLDQARRNFMKTTAGAFGMAAVAGFPALVSGQKVSNSIKVGLVGCGGRGTGAASQSLQADDYAELTAVADIDQAQVDNCLQTLKSLSKVSDRVQVESSHQFLGLDAYKKVI